MSEPRTGIEVVRAILVRAARDGFAAQGDPDATAAAIRLVEAHERLSVLPVHPHDGYAYDGCKCVCCVNVRALALPVPALDALARALQHGAVFGWVYDSEEAPEGYWERKAASILAALAKQEDDPTT